MLKQRIVQLKELPCRLLTASPREDFGRVLKAFREHFGIRQSDLGAAIGTTQSTVTRVESGRVDFPVSRISSYARALGCSFIEVSFCWRQESEQPKVTFKVPLDLEENGE